MRDPLWITGYSEGTIYEEQARECLASMDALNLPGVIYPFPDQGSWARNCQMKVNCILQAMSEEPTSPIIWIDADARIVRSPTLLLEGFPTMFAARLHGSARKILSGTLWISPDARPLVEEWQAACDQDHKVWDQRVLDAVISKSPSGARSRGMLTNLPREYCAILLRSGQGYDHPDPIITQGQVSRIVRREGRFPKDTP